MDLYLLTRRKPPSRFCNPLFIFSAVSPFSAAARWQAELADMIQNRPPKIIVMCVSNDAPRRFQYPPAGSKSPIAALVNQALEDHYQRVKRIKQFEIYERIC